MKLILYYAIGLCVWFVLYLLFTLLLSWLDGDARNRFWKK